MGEICTGSQCDALGENPENGGRMNKKIVLQHFEITDYGSHLVLSNEKGSIEVPYWSHLARLAQDLLRVVPLTNFLSDDELERARVHLGGGLKC